MIILTTLMETVLVAAFIAAVAFGGIMCGKKLRVRKNAKLAQETVTAENAE